MTGTVSSTRWSRGWSCRGGRGHRPGVADPDGVLHQQLRRVAGLKAYLLFRVNVGCRSRLEYVTLV